MIRASSRLRKPVILWMVLTICLILLSGCSPSLTTGGHSTPETPSAPADTVEVVYFHRPQRCSGCLYAEAGTQFTLENYFASELAEGKIAFKVIDLGDKANTAIVEHYGAYTSSLFINGIRDGTDYIEEVTDIWLVLGKDSEFIAIVKDKIESCLGEKQP